MPFPVFQKFYSALACLNRFSAENDLIENISNIDGFLTEFRATQFALVNKLGNTRYFLEYDKLSKKYIPSDVYHLLIDLRNHEIHNGPSELNKSIQFLVFTQEDYVGIQSKDYRIDDEQDFDGLKDNLKEYLKTINKDEVYFSVEYCYNEVNTGENILEKILSGIQGMWAVLNELKRIVPCNLVAINKVEDKINNLHIINIPLEYQTIVDYVYFPQTDQFERVERMDLSPMSRKDLTIFEAFEKLYVPSRADLRNKTDLKGPLQTVFLQYIMQNLPIYMMQKDFLPTYVVIYEDDTFCFRSFNASQVTTFFRKENELAKEIEKGKIKAVFYAAVVNFYRNSEVVKDLNREDREKQAETAMDFRYIDKDLVFKEYTFNTRYVENKDYLWRILKKSNQQDFLKNSPAMVFIRKAFAHLKDV